MSDTFSVACVQTDPRFGEASANCAVIDALLADVQADLVVLPELFATGYSFVDRDEAMSLAQPLSNSSAVERLCAWSQRTGGMLVAGLAERDGEHVFNSAAVVAEGNVLGCYRKAHLFGFERECFDPGDTPFRVFTYNDLRVGVMICFDWVFPEAARCLALAGAEVIAHPSNLVTPGWCQKAMQVRAIENMVATATANRFGTEHRAPRPPLTFTGESLICGPWGDELARAPSNRACVVRAVVDRADISLKRFPSGNELLQDRRPDLYRIVVDKPLTGNDLAT